MSVYRDYGRSAANVTREGADGVRLTSGKKHPQLPLTNTGYTHTHTHVICD